MAKLKIFKNVANLPDPDTGQRTSRLQLKVNADNVPIKRYWRKRFNEGGIVCEDDIPKKQTKNLKKTSSKDSDSNRSISQSLVSESANDKGEA